MSEKKTVPYLIEIGFLVAKSTTLIVGGIVLVISLINGCDIYRTILRTAVSIIVCGFLFWLILMMLSKGFMFAYVSLLFRNKEEDHKDNREMVA